MRAEMVAAKDQSGIDAKNFDKSQHNRPLSQLSDFSDESRIPVDVSYSLANLWIPCKLNISNLCSIKKLALLCQ